MFSKGFLFFLNLLMFYLSESGIAGFYHESELLKALMNASEKCFSSELLKDNFHNYVSIRPKNQVNFQKVLIFGGFYGSLTAAAEIISFLSNFCNDLRFFNDWSHLYENFQFDFLPVTCRGLYHQSYNLKTSENKDVIVKSQNSFDPFENFREYRNNLECESFILDNIQDYNIIIMIQGNKNNYDSGTKVTALQDYVYKSVLGTKPRVSSSSSFNYAVLNYFDSFVFQFKHRLRKKINPQKIENEFKSQFYNIFSKISNTFQPPLFQFITATENKSSKKENNKNVNFLFAVVNRYALNIDFKIFIDLSVLIDENFRILEFLEYQEADVLLYGQRDEEFISMDNGRAEWISDEIDEKKISRYYLNVSFLNVLPFSTKKFKFVFNKTAEGEIKFDLRADAKDYWRNFGHIVEGIEVKGRTVQVVSKELKIGENYTKAPKFVVLALMILVFFGIVFMVAYFLLFNNSKEYE